jgi:N utilization substance protein B
VTTRRKGREAALQILYALDANASVDVADASHGFFNHLEGGGSEQGMEHDDFLSPEQTSPSLDPREQTPNWAQTLAHDVTSHRDELDAAISQTSRNWRIERMARVDRNILRLALFELKYCPDVPVRVTLNEAIELAKRFGTAESPAFINGILDSTVKALAIAK